MNKPRYIIRGLIDGCLSVLGVIIGGYNPDFSIIISAGISGAMANGFSNMLAALSAEEAARYKYLRELEESMLTDLSNTAQEKKVKKVIKKSALYDGCSTVIGGVIPIIPFFIFLKKSDRQIQRWPRISFLTYLFVATVSVVAPFFFSSQFETERFSSLITRWELMRGGSKYIRTHLTEPAGLLPSSLPSSVLLRPAVIRLRRTSGVLPTMSSSVG